VSDVGLCLSCFADRPTDQALAATRELGITTIDLPLDSTFRLRPFGRDASREDISALTRTVRDSEIAVACVSNSRDCQLIMGPYGEHTNGVLADDAAAKKAHGYRHAEEAIRVAEALDAPLVRLFFGCPDFGRWLSWPNSVVSWADNIDEFVTSVGPLAELASSVGRTLCIEPHPKQVAYNAQSLMDCLSGLQPHSLGVCFDPANVGALGYDPVDFLRVINTVPVALHAKDLEVWGSAGPPLGKGWVSYGPQAPIRFRSVPWGTLDWRAIFSLLSEEGFHGPVFIEHEDLLTSRTRGVREARTFLSSLINREPEAERWW